MQKLSPVVWPLALAALCALFMLGPPAWGDAPVCSITGDDTGNTGDLLLFNASGSYDPDGGSIVSYVWDFGVPVVELHTNPGFEAGWNTVNQPCGSETGVIGDGWTAWADNGCSGDPWTYSDGTPAACEGAHSQRVEYNGGSRGFYNLITGLTPGRTYQVSGCIRIDSPRPDGPLGGGSYWAEFGVTDGGPPTHGDPWLWKSDGLGLGPEPYTWHTFSYTVTPATNTLACWYKFGGTGDDAPYVGYGDAVSVVERTRALWTVQYDGDVDPTAADPPWICEPTCGGDAYTVDLGNGNSAWHINDGNASKNKYRRDGEPDVATGLTVLTRVKYLASSAVNNAQVCNIQTNGKRLQIYWHDGSFGLAPGGGSGSFTQGMPVGEYHTLRITVDPSANTWQMYYDEGLSAIGSGTLGSSTGNIIYWGAASTGETCEMEVDYFYYTLNGVYGPGVMPNEGPIERASWSEDGTYEVCVTVTDDEAESSTCCMSVTINNRPPTCSIEYDPTPPAVGETVTFVGTAADPDGTVIAYSWDFGDGVSGIGGNPVTHAYTTGGDKTVTLTVTDDDAETGTCTTVVHVNIAPTCSFTGPTTGFTGVEYCYDGSGSSDPDGSIVEYFWDFDDATPDPPAGTVQNPSFEDASAWTKYGGSKLPDTEDYCGFGPRPGGYAYLGNAVNSGGLAEQGAYQTVSGLLAGGAYRARVWIMTRGDPTPSAVACRIGVDPDGGTDPEAGSVVWSADAQNDGCPPSGYLQISVDFEAGAGGLATIFCEFSASSQTWNIVAMDDVDLIGIGGTAIGNPGCHAFQSGGTHNVCLIVTDNEGASATCCQTVTITAVDRPYCNITYSPAEPTVADTITFNANAGGTVGPYSYAWDFGDGGTATTDPATHQYLLDGGYTVTCVVTDSQPPPGPWDGTCVAQVNVVSKPVCVISGPTSVPAWSRQCYDGSDSYDPDNCGGVFPCPPEGIVSYVWDFGAVSGRNFVRNGDFEGGFEPYDIEGDRVATLWTKFKEDPNPLLYDETSTVHSPLYSQAVAWNDLAGSARSGIYQVVSGLSAGKPYKIAMWLRGQTDSGNPADVTAQAGYDLDGGSDIGGVDEWFGSFTGDDAWHEATAQVIATGSTLSIWYSFRSEAPPPGANFYGYADDASVLEVATGPTACNIFTEQGTATVNLTVIDDEGLTTSCSLSVTVGAPASQQPTCSISVSTPTYTQLLITFTATASDPDGTVVGYDWEFGDGGIATGNPATHTYAAGSAGNYTVNLMVTDNTATVGLCSETVNVTNPAPTCAFTMPGGTPQPGQEVCFDGTISSDENGTIASYLWDFGVPTDLTSALLTNPGFETGDFTGWTLKGTQQADVVTQLPDQCAGLLAPDGVGSFAYDQWGAGGLNIWGQILQTTSTATTTLVPGETYRVDSYVVSYSSCDEDPTVRVGVDPQAGTTYLSPSVVWSAPITPAMSAPCTWYGEKVSVTFTAETSKATVFLFYNHNNIYEGCGGSVAAFDDVKFYQQPSSTDPAPCYIFGAADTYTITLTVTDDEGASSTCSQELTVGEPTGEPPECDDPLTPEPGVSMTSDPDPPVKDTVITFTSDAYDPDGTIVSYQWNFGDGNTATGNPVTHSFDAPGSYAVRCVVTDNDGNSTTCSAGVDVENAAPECCISGPDIVVVGQEACWSSCSTDIDGTIDSYLWTFGEGNLVVNGNFEGGFHDVSGPRITAGSQVADGWSTWPVDPGWGNDALYRAETTNQHGGAKCQAMDFTETSRGIYQVVNGTEAGKQYLFTAWMRLDTNDAGGPPWYELGWDLDGGTTEPPDPPAGPWVQFQPAITGLPYGQWYSNHNDDVDPGPPYKSRVLTATGPKISIWTKWGNIWDATPRTGYVDDVSLLEFETTETVCHTYQEAGDYSLELTVTDDKGAATTCAMTVTVLPSEPPTCSFTMSPSPATINRTVTFDSTSTDPDGTIVAWDWDFGDGNIGSGDPAVHAYSTGGSYTVELTVTDNTGVGATCTDTIEVAETLEVAIPLTDTGWHMIALPLEPVNKTILIERGTMAIDPDSIFYDSYVAGNDPVNRLFRTEPGVGYWTYNPELDPFHKWYEIGVDPPVEDPPIPHPGPWWQGFWFLIDVPHTLTYTAYPPADVEERFLDITTSPLEWAWMMIGGFGIPSDPYDPDVTTWTGSSMVTDTTFGVSTPPTPPASWVPTADCDLADAWDSGYIGLPLSGYIPDAGYYQVSPSQALYCGAMATTDSLAAGEGFWLDVEDLEVWMKLTR